MASFDFDQAEGLRRMLAGPKPRILTFLSATQDAEKCAMLVNLAASFSQSGSNALLFDARTASQGIASKLDAMRSATLLQVSRQERALDEVVQTMPQGFGVATMARGLRPGSTVDPEQARRLAQVFNVLAKRVDIMMVDAELDRNDSFPIATLATSDIVVQVSNSPDSIKSAYALIKRVHGQTGRRPFNIVVTGADEKESQVVFQNMAQVASRYLAVKLHSLGFVPADEHVKRAACLGRSVIDAFPMAGASVAFRRLAARFSLLDTPAPKLRGISGTSGHGMNHGL